MKIVVINGPNLNMLGIREPEIYGNADYSALCEYIKKICSDNNIADEIFQSNSEGEIIDRIHKAYYENADGIIINPAAYTHTSIAIMDALKTVMIPTVEVHLTDIYKREPFRRNSYIKIACAGEFYGKGFESYRDAVLFLLNYEKQRNKTI